MLDPSSPNFNWELYKSRMAPSAQSSNAFTPQPDYGGLPFPGLPSNYQSPPTPPGWHEPFGPAWSGDPTVDQMTAAYDQQHLFGGFEPVSGQSAYAIPGLALPPGQMAGAVDPYAYRDPSSSQYIDPATGASNDSGLDPRYFRQEEVQAAGLNAPPPPRGFPPGAYPWTWQNFGPDNRNNAWINPANVVSQDRLNEMYPGLDSSQPNTSVKQQQSAPPQQSDMAANPPGLDPYSRAREPYVNPNAWGTPSDPAVPYSSEQSNVNVPANAWGRSPNLYDFASPQPGTGYSYDQGNQDPYAHGGNQLTSFNSYYNPGYDPNMSGYNYQPYSGGNYGYDPGYGLSQNDYSNQYSDIPMAYSGGGGYGWGGSNYVTSADTGGGGYGGSNYSSGGDSYG